jgi:hypothetical protein
MKEAKLANKATPDHRTVVNLNDRVACGGNELLIIAGRKFNPDADCGR